MYRVNDKIETKETTAAAVTLSIHNIIIITIIIIL